MNTPVNTPVGFIVSWRVPAVVDLSDLRASLVNAGLDAVELAPDLRPASLVARSASFIARATSGKDERKLARPRTYTSRQITREEKDAASNLTYTKEAAIEYNDLTGKLECDEPSMATALADTAKHVTATRTASDVTRIIQQIVEEAGTDLIPVREQGGAYFIPQGHGVIGRVATVLEGVRGGLSTFACTLGHGTDESVSVTITDYLIKQIEELQESVDALNEKGIRSDVKNRRLSRVAELKEKISVYASLISTGAEKLNAELARAEMTLLAKLGPSEDDEEEDDAAAAPAVVLEEESALV